MKNLLLLPAAALVMLSSSCGESESVPDACFTWDVDSTNYNLAKYVDPMIGTGGHGHTFPGATAPFGMVQLSPDTRIDGSWDGCSGYHYGDSIIYGFSHTHLSGTGCSDYGDVMLLPGQGEKYFTAGTDSTKGYRTGFKHENEVAEAGYYSVKLNSGVQCELTASPRVGVHRYTFAGNGDAWIILDMAHRDEVLDCEIEIVNDHTILGKRFSKAWATNQQLWFYAEFSEPFTHELWSNGAIMQGKTTNAKDAKAMLSFSAKEVEVKVALSPVSTENAKMNLLVETQDMNFNLVREKVKQNWNAELSRIEVESSDETKKKIFYTALYHCFIAPNVYCDVNGEYQGMDHKVYRDTVHQRYTVFSLWDTYRALHPLFTIVQQKRTNDFINTFLQQYKESGRLPVWELSSNETDCMIGYHSVSVIADAWMKGITDYDTALAYEAMKASAMENRSGLESYRKYGFIPAEGESESVSKTLEYAYDDWCISQCAGRMGDTAGFKQFAHRAGNWRNLYNPETKFMQARLNNTFVTPFDPFEVNFHYTEANAWQYSLAVQHDPMGLISLHTAQGLQEHLNNLFSVSAKTTGRDQADITGLIGQYAHGNEPSHHMAYLYATLNEDWKTQELVHQICNTLYTDKPDGLCGNEDCGQMSAWYVLSAAGFYPITPGLPEYTIGSPQFTSVKFHLENGNTFTINTQNADNNVPYVSVWQKNSIGNHTIPFSLIQNGGKVDLSKENEREPIINNTDFIYLSDQTVTPWLTGPTTRTFTDRMVIGMRTLDATDEIYYSINGGPYKKYSSAITISENSTISMYATGSNKFMNTVSMSDTATAQFYKAPSWKSIAIRHAYAPQYSAGGDRALIDGLAGTTNFRTGLWQGYEGVDMDVVVDLGKEMNVDSVYVGFLVDKGAWIFAPEKVVVVVSNDSSTIQSDSRNTMYFANDGSITGGGTNRIGIPGGTGRFVHVLATSIKTCPKGHPGEGKPAWLFADEIRIITK